MRLVICCWLAPALLAQEFPQATISNGAVTAKLYLPDPERGYYRGTRFDWSGVIYSLRTLGHEYFGQWFERYDPKLHDAIMGPVEEFKTGDSSVGYEEAAPGGVFLRIGVGAVRKPEEPKFQPFKTYEVDPGVWKVDKGSDWIRFEHVLKDTGGYAYRYTKTIRLTKGKPEMTIEHTLANRGSKRIETSQYNHNFFVMDGQPTGPGASVRFPWRLQPQQPARGASLASIDGGAITYTAAIDKGQSVYGEFKGFGASASDYDVAIEHRGAGAGVRIQGDRPMHKLVFWSIRTTLCPEPYIDVSADPGKETQWKYVYSFYELK